MKKNKNRKIIFNGLIIFPFVLYAIYLTICSIFPYCLTPDYIKKDQLDLIYNYYNSVGVILTFLKLICILLVFLCLIEIHDNFLNKKKNEIKNIKKCKFIISITISLIIFYILFIFLNNFNNLFFKKLNRNNPNNLVIGYEIKPEKDLISNFEYLQEKEVLPETINKIEYLFNGYLFKNKFHIFTYKGNSFNQKKSITMLNSEYYYLLSNGNILKDPSFYLLVIDRQNNKVYVNNNIGNKYTVDQIISSLNELKEINDKLIKL